MGRLGHVVVWKIADLAKIADGRRRKEFDCIIAFCGPRGNTKSTGGYKLGLKLGFKPERDLIYDRKELVNALQDWDRIIDADEMINSAYKREFYNVDQIELVKLVNMYRDHRHVIIMCIPNFWDLDKPLRDLVKIRVDMIRRGFGVVHMPLQLSYSNDAWDQKVNEKIERGWLRKGGEFKPKFKQLTTFIGYLKFGKLAPDQEAKYKRLKEEKRIALRKDKDALTKDKEKDPREILLDRAIQYVEKGEYNRDDLVRLAYTSNINWKTFIDLLNKRLDVLGKATTINKILKAHKKVSSVTAEGKQKTKTSNSNDVSVKNNFIRIPLLPTNRH